MSVVFRFAGLRVVIWPNDHRPAHVHVMSSDAEAVFKLNCPFGPPELRESMGFKLHEINKIRQVLANEVVLLCLKWSESHGTY